MKEENNNIHKSILLYAVLLLVVCIIISVIVENLGYVFMQWVEITIVSLVIFSLIVGIGQLLYNALKTGKRDKKKFKNRIIACTSIAIFIASLILIFKYHVINKYDELIAINSEGEKIVKVIEHVWLDPDVVREYRYKNKFLREKDEINSSANNIMQQNVVENNVPYADEKEIRVDEENFVLKTKYSDGETIAIEYIGNSVGQKTNIRVLNSQDDGKTWEYQNEFMNVNNGATYTEINGKIYINDMGIISYGEKNSILLVSEDRGVSFIRTKIEIPDDIFVQEIEDVPYLENGIYKFKTKDYDGNELFYESLDGIEWKLVK